MRQKFLIPGFFAAIVSGCAGSATHEIVSAHQATDESLTCVQLTAEITKAQVVIDGVNKDKDDLTAADITDGLLWFPFNLIAKDGNYKDAIQAADRRIDRLARLKKEKNCSTIARNNSDTSDIVEKISKLNQLYKAGAIDAEEYKALKQKLLSGITGAGPVGSGEGEKAIFGKGVASEIEAVEEEWQRSGVRVVSGRSYEITASGSWTVNSERCGWSGPDGGSGPCSSPLSDPQDFAASYSALIGRIGEGPVFLVGSRVELTADRSGDLLFRVNDSPGGFDNNEGTITVRTATISSP